LKRRGCLDRQFVRRCVIGVFWQYFDLRTGAFGVDHRYPREARLGKIKYRFATVQNGQGGCPLNGQLASS